MILSNKKEFTLMIKRIVIVRHGNTFLPDEVPTRVGKNTDLPLVENKRGIAVGKWMKSKNIIPDTIFASPLKRTMQTAILIKNELQLEQSIVPLDSFTEIDYGPDENQPETNVIARLGRLYLQEQQITLFDDKSIEEMGKHVLKQWDENGKVPTGWIVDTEKIKNDWLKFAQSIPPGKTALVCSSNGIIRFAPYMLDIPYTKFCEENNIKVATGSVSVFEFTDNKWHCNVWNEKPYNLF